MRGGCRRWGRGGERSEAQKAKEKYDEYEPTKERQNEYSIPQRLAPI